MPAEQVFHIQGFFLRLGTRRNGGQLKGRSRILNRALEKERVQNLAVKRRPWKDSLNISYNSV